MSRELRKIGAEGILTEEDLPKLGTQRRRVYDLLCDNNWHSGPEICLAAEGSEGLRRARELRALPGASLEIYRHKERRCFYYRLLIDAPQMQQELGL